MEADSLKPIKQVARQLRRSFGEHGFTVPTSSAALEPLTLWALRLAFLRALEARNLAATSRSTASSSAGRPRDTGQLRSLCEQLAEHIPDLFDDPEPLAELEPVLARGLQTFWPTDPDRDAELHRAFQLPTALGWFYQYWCEAQRQRVLADLRSAPAQKITGADVVPATQLYTQRYMTRFLVQNTLGSLWQGMGGRCPEWPWRAAGSAASVTGRLPARRIRVLDPACGAGHFLLEAFDRLYDLHRAEHSQDAPESICRAILADQLCGIDIDPLALSVAAASLWLRAVERAPQLARERLPMQLVAATAPSSNWTLAPPLPDSPMPKTTRLLAHLEESFRNAHRLGSLLDLTKLLLSALRRERIAASDEQLAAAYERVRVSLPREEPKRHHLVRTSLGSLVELLEQRYDVVVTNPPFLGCRTMGEPLRKFIERNYPSGKRDLYTAFMIRCGELARDGGRVGLVTQHSWMFLRCYSELRSGGPPGRGLLRDYTIELLAHLGTGNFDGLNGEVVNTVLLTLAKQPPEPEHMIQAFRLVGPGRRRTKSSPLRQSVRGELPQFTYRTSQAALAELPLAPVIYWIDKQLLQWLRSEPTLASLGGVKQGLATGDNRRFVRYSFECPDSDRWQAYAKGGGICRWHGLQRFRVDWQHEGVRLRNAFDESGRRQSVIRNETTYLQPGITYSLIARGTLALRVLDGSLYDVASMSLFPAASNWDRYSLMALLNSSLYTYLARLISQDLKFNTSYITRLPLPPGGPGPHLGQLAKLAVAIKARQTSRDLLDETFRPPASSARDLVEYCREELHSELAAAAWLHTVEGAVEREVQRRMQLDDTALEPVRGELGVPSGCLPRLAQDVSLPALDSLPLAFGNPLLEEVPTCCVDDQRLQELRTRVEQQFRTGPSATEDSEAEDSEVCTSERSLELPSETFLDELARKFHVHPVSMYQLVRDGLHQGWRCGPEEYRLVTDLVTAVVLRLFGHRGNEPGLLGRAPQGVLRGAASLIATSGSSPFIPSVEQALASLFPETSADTLRQQLTRTLGCSLGTWLQHKFFLHHVRQFRRRPLLWQIQSSRFTRQKEPEAAYLVYYHALSPEVLRRIARECESRAAEMSGSSSSDNMVARRKKSSRELTDFAQRIEQLLTAGFSSSELARRSAEEPLDDWCRLTSEHDVPESRNGFLAQEAAYIPDLHDGVRVNLAPFQCAGLLAERVLTREDVDRAIKDRARWRSEERRLCREGKLDRPGWWN